MARKGVSLSSAASGVIGVIFTIALTLGVMLIVLAAFQNATDNTSTAYTVLGSIQTQISNNMALVGLIVVVAFIGIALLVLRLVGFSPF